MIFFPAIFGKSLGRWFMALGESHILLVTELTEIRIIRVISWRIKLMSGTGCRYESVLYHPSKLSTAEEEVFWTHNWQLSRHSGHSWSFACEVRSPKNCLVGQKSAGSPFSSTWDNLEWKGARKKNAKIWPKGTGHCVASSGMYYYFSCGARTPLLYVWIQSAYVICISTVRKCLMFPFSAYAPRKIGCSLGLA